MANKSPNPNTRFKKGQSGNPKGNPPADPKIKLIKKYTAEEFELLVSTLLNFTEKELLSAMNDAATPYIKRIVASILAKTFETGSMGQLDMVLNRVIGKVKEKLDLNLRPSILRRVNGEEVVFTNRAPEEE